MPAALEIGCHCNRLQGIRDRKRKQETSGRRQQSAPTVVSHDSRGPSVYLDSSRNGAVGCWKHTTNRDPGLPFSFPLSHFSLFTFFFLKKKIPFGLTPQR